LLLGLWHVVRPAQTTLHEWVTAQHFDFVDGSHDGYTHLRHPITHRRQIFFAKPDYWIVLDLLGGQGRHRYDLFFHLVPDARVLLDPISGMAQVAHHTGTDLLICPIHSGECEVEIVAGRLDPIQGWLSPYSGEKTPAPTLRYTKVAPAPTQFGTILYPCQQTGDIVLKVLPLAVVGEEKGLRDRDVTGLKIEIGPWVDYFVIDHRECPSLKTFEGYVADGRLVYLRQRSRDGVLVKAVLHRGSELRLNDVPLHVSGDDIDQSTLEQAWPHLAEG
jgi:hypothetical protein